METNWSFTNAVWTYVLTNRAMGTFELLLEPNRWKVRAQLKLLLQRCAYFNNLQKKKRSKILCTLILKNNSVLARFSRRHKIKTLFIYRLISAVCGKILFVRLPFIVLCVYPFTKHDFLDFCVNIPYALGGKLYNNSKLCIHTGTQRKTARMFRMKRKILLWWVWLVLRNVLFSFYVVNSHTGSMCAASV